jgi:hypothetical protein
LAISGRGSDITVHRDFTGDTLIGVKTVTGADSLPATP